MARSSKKSGNITKSKAIAKKMLQGKWSPPVENQEEELTKPKTKQGIKNSYHYSKLGRHWGRELVNVSLSSIEYSTDLLAIKPTQMPGQRKGSSNTKSRSGPIQEKKNRRC